MELLVEILCACAVVYYQVSILKELFLLKNKVQDLENSIRVIEDNNDETV